MGRMKEKLIDMMENPEYYDEGMDMGDEYEILLPKGMKMREVLERLDRKDSEDQEDPEELDFDLD